MEPTDNNLPQRNRTDSPAKALRQTSIKGSQVRGSRALSRVNKASPDHKDSKHRLSKGSKANRARGNKDNSPVSSRASKGKGSKDSSPANSRDSREKVRAKARRNNSNKPTLRTQARRRKVSRNRTNSSRIKIPAATATASAPINGRTCSTRPVPVRDRPIAPIRKPAPCSVKTISAIGPNA